MQSRSRFRVRWALRGLAMVGAFVIPYWIQIYSEPYIGPNVSIVISIPFTIALSIYSQTHPSNETIF